MRYRPIWDYFIFNGTSCLDFGVKLSDADYGTAARDIESVSVPGRSGELTIDNGRFRNKTVKYPMYIVEDLENRLPAFINFLMAQSGYCRLEDTFHPDVYRMARYSGPFDPSSTYFNDAATFNISFDCMPQKWLKTGEIPITVDDSASVVIYNPSYQTALPLITVTAGTGEIWIDNQMIQVDTNSGGTVIDSEMMDCYEGTTSRTGDVSFSDGEYPKLTSGEHTITVDSGMEIEITPRWWIL